MDEMDRTRREKRILVHDKANYRGQCICDAVLCPCAWAGTKRMRFPLWKRCGTWRHFPAWEQFIEDALKSYGDGT